MSEYKTLKEWFGQATRGDGRKFACKDWLENQWLEPIYLDRYEDWHCLDHEGYSRAWGRNLYLFREWHPPKKKVTKYLFVHKDSGGITLYMEKDMSEFIDPEKYIRLDWSATEFDDE